MGLLMWVVGLAVKHLDDSDSEDYQEKFHDVPNTLHINVEVEQDSE